MSVSHVCKAYCASSGSDSRKDGRAGSYSASYRYCMSSFTVVASLSDRSILASSASLPVNSMALRSAVEREHTTTL